jgi:ribonuclease BN (tRNA processing enzyme)
MSVRLKVIGSSPAWPNPGGAHSGYLLESADDRLLLDCGPGVLARLREGEEWPRVNAIAITHFHLDHWGDLVPWVWGSMYRAGNGNAPARPVLWVYDGGREHLEQLGSRLGFPDMFERQFELAEYGDGEPFGAAGFDVMPLRLPHYTLETYGFRVSRDGVTLAYSGDTGPSDRLTELARDADLFVCEATLLRGEDDGLPRGHLSLDEALAAHRDAHARRLLLTHRPSELPLDNGFELAYDGLELELERDSR